MSRGENTIACMFAMPQVGREICSGNGQKLAITQIVGIKAQHGLAGMLVMSAVLLFYTCALVPVQICMWDYDNNCVKFPTLYFDVFVDVFFLVRTTLWT